MSKKAFVICPVRNGVPPEVIKCVADLEDKGWVVHFPPRDTPQVSDTGYDICLRNMAEIKAADRVYIFWDGESQGCLFDVGMAFAFKKNIEVLHLPQITSGKSFQNMISEWASGC